MGGPAKSISVLPPLHKSWKVTQLSASKSRYLNLSGTSLYCVSPSQLHNLSAGRLARWKFHAPGSDSSHPLWLPPPASLRAGYLLKSQMWWCYGATKKNKIHPESRLLNISSSFQMLTLIHDLDTQLECEASMTKVLPPHNGQVVTQRWHEVLRMRLSQLRASAPESRGLHSKESRVQYELGITTVVNVCGASICLCTKSNGPKSHETGGASLKTSSEQV